MERLVDELAESGVLDAEQARSARAHQAEHGGSLDTALLELDLIDEAALLRGLQRRFGVRVASPSDLGQLDSGVAERLPESFSKSFRMCPLRFEARSLIAFVQGPLPSEWVQELRDVFGVELEQLVAPTHYLALARSKVYGATLEERSIRLEQRLARRRAAPDVARVAANMATRESLSASMDELLDFAAHLVDFACFVAVRNGKLQLVGARGGAPMSLPPPEAGCTLGPALLHGGYFLGPLANTDADIRFYRELGRAVPRTAFVAPVPVAQGSAVVLYADNGSGGIATRFIAELTVLVGRLGHRAVPAQPRRAARDGTPHAEAATMLSPEEHTVLSRLHARAEQANTTLTALVDELLELRPPAPTSDRAALELVGEMKSLFERLATDIPAHLARGMELAFRDVAPRLGAGAAPMAPRATAQLEVVESASEREVASYAARRKKTPRLKL